MRKDKINDNEKVLRFDLPLDVGSAKLVVHCKIDPERSNEERDAKAKRVFERMERCATEGAKLLVEICEFANDPGDVAGLALAYASGCVRSATEVHKHYMLAFGEAVDKKLAARAAGESGSETGPARKKD